MSCEDFKPADFGVRLTTGKDGLPPDNKMPEVGSRMASRNDDLPTGCQEFGLRINKDQEKCSNGPDNKKEKTHYDSSPCDVLAKSLKIKKQTDQNLDNKPEVKEDIADLEQEHQTKDKKQAEARSREDSDEIIAIKKCVQHFNENKDVNGDKEKPVIFSVDNKGMEMMLTSKQLNNPKTKYYPENHKEVERRGYCGLVTRFDDKLVEKVIEWKKNITVYATEITIPLKFSNPGIVQMAGLKREKGYLYIYMNNAGRPLNELIEEKSFVEHFAEYAIFYSQQLYRIVRLLEENGVAHRDIKLENICAKMENGVYVFCLVDFGSAQEYSEENPVVSAHTITHLCPGLAKLVKEKYEKRNVKVNPKKAFFDLKGDCYSLTLTLIQILTKKKWIHKISYSKTNNTRMPTQLENTIAFLDMITKMPDDYWESRCEEIGCNQPDLGLVFRQALLLDKDARWSAAQCDNYLQPFNDLHPPPLLKKAASTESENEINLDNFLYFKKEQCKPNGGEPMEQGQSNNEDGLQGMRVNLKVNKKNDESAFVGRQEKTKETSSFVLSSRQYLSSSSHSGNS